MVSYLLRGFISNDRIYEKQVTLAARNFSLHKLSRLSWCRLWLCKNCNVFMVAKYVTTLLESNSAVSLFVKVRFHE